MSKTNNTQKAQLEIKKADFEELISNFAESEEILYYYNGDKEALKSFCLETYGLNFRQTYNKLLAKAKIELRKKLLKVFTTYENMKNYLKLTFELTTPNNELLNALMGIAYKPHTRTIL